MSKEIHGVSQLCLLVIVFLGTMILIAGPAEAAAVKAKDAYLERRSKVQSNDADSLYQLARWVWKKHSDNIELLDNARMDLREALKLKPGHARAKLLLRQVNAKTKILRKKAATLKPAGLRKPVIADKYLLSQRDILWVRLKEYNPRIDKKVSIKFKNRVLRRYCDTMRGSEDDGWDKIGKEKRFYKMPYWKRMDEILRNRPDDIQLLEDIHITRDPKFMVDFRSKVWPVVQQQCGGVNCHGGSEPKGGFKLFTTASRNEKVDYTNFIILSGFRKGGQCLLDRQRVENSLLLQYGLNSKVSKKLHPKVGGAEIKPAFLSMKSATYKNIRKWIASLNGPLAPDYHLKYKPPFGMKLNTSGLPDMPNEPKKAETGN